MDKEIGVGEIWKDIKGYEGLYQISNQGRIKSLARKVNYMSSQRNVREKIKKTFVGSRGYERVELSRDGINKKYNVHRIVAKTFIDNPENKLEVNHKNGIKTDNRVENLEWCTSKENQVHAIKMGLQKPSEKQKAFISKYSRENKPKIVIQMNLNRKVLREWKSAVEAEKETGISAKSISQCVTGRSKTAGGFIWRLKK